MSESLLTQISEGRAFSTSHLTEELDKALAKAQAEILSALKNRENPHFRSSYADLEAIFAACRPALTKHGVSLTQWPVHSEDNRLHIITRIAHNGQWMRAEFSVPVDKNSAQGYGSAITYAKRYALAAAVGVADVDDDGEAASAGHPPGHVPQAPSQRQKPGAYVIGFGKFKGKALEEVPPKELLDYCNYIQNKAIQENKEITGTVREFIDKAAAMLLAETERTDVPSSEAMPWEKPLK